jgi:hypothetical protein
MTFAFLTRVILSAIIVAAIAMAARRSPAVGALVASLPLISMLAILWMWHDTHDAGQIADFMTINLVYWIPSIPLFVLTPWLLRNGTNFWISLGVGVGMTFAGYLLTSVIAARYGMKL